MLIAINKNPFQHEDVLRFDFGLTATERYVEVMKARMRVSVSFQTHTAHEADLWVCGLQQVLGLWVSYLFQQVTHLTEADRCYSSLYLFTFYLSVYSDNTVIFFSLHLYETATKTKHILHILSHFLIR